MDDLETRCWRCKKWRYFDINHGGEFVDDVWQCDTCVQQMTDKRVKHYTATALLNWRPRGRR